VSGYAIDGHARYAGIWEQRDGPDWQARHGMTRVEYQQTFDALAPLGYVLTKVCGYRVNVDVLFAAIWEKRDGVVWEAHHGLTAGGYQAKFDELNAAGYRLTVVSGYSDTGIARYAAVWEKSDGGAWQARHGLDPAAYQQTFDDLNNQGFRLAPVSGYGDGTFRPIGPFEGAVDLRDFASADLDGDGNPDAAALDARGTLRIYDNERAGRFRPLPDPKGTGGSAALAIAAHLGGPWPLVARLRMVPQPLREIAVNGNEPVAALSRL